MNILLRCRCGALQGQVELQRAYARAVCYCRDCQAFARFLGQPSDTLDANGGTEIVATLPASVRITTGVDRLACMALSERGMFRWYAACCRTPIGNTPRTRKMAYVGLVQACLPDSATALDQSLGPRKVALNTASATGPVRDTPVAAAASVLGIMARVMGARLSGRYRSNPFFRADASGTPVCSPQVLTAHERQALEGRA